MTTHRTVLPQVGGALAITDGGLETDLIFHRGFDLPEFAAFPLAGHDEGRAALRAYYDDYVEIARTSGAGLVLESPTWRASLDWAAKLGLTANELESLTRQAIALLREIRETAADLPYVVVSGCVGPRGDGYVVGNAMDADTAEAYHATHIAIFADEGVDMVAAITMTYPEEAIGIVRAAQASGLPVAISFTVETDGKLPNGESLADAIARVDAATSSGAAYFMVNCAHPEHFEHVLDPSAPSAERIRGIRANASRLSHAELDEAEELDEGDPVELGAAYRRLRQLLPAISVVGGCCGTDHRHVRAIAVAWSSPPFAAGQ